MRNDFLPETCCGTTISWVEGKDIDYKFKSAKCPSCLTEYVQNLGSGRLYVKAIGDKSFVHNNCGLVLKLKSVFHRIEGRDGVNYGESIIEIAPYCPRHEHEPAVHGSPIFYGPIPTHEGALLVLAEREILNKENQKLEKKEGFNFVLKNVLTADMSFDDVEELIEDALTSDDDEG